MILSPSRQEDSDWAYQQADAAGIEVVQVIPQQTGNLGERINQLDQTIRQFGQPNTVFIGTDAPMLTAKHYAEVITQLAENDIVLSQAEDGGLVIMANAQPWPVLTELPWSQVTLGDEINHCCQQNGLKVGFSTSGYDIDFKEDLLRFYQEFKETDVPARQALITTIEHLGIK